MRSANDFMSLFSQWSGIRTQEVVPKYRFISEQKAPSIHVTNFALAKIDYEELPQDPFVSGATTQPNTPSQTAQR